MEPLQNSQTTCPTLIIYVDSPMKKLPECIIVYFNKVLNKNKILLNNMLVQDTVHKLTPLLS